MASFFLAGLGLLMLVGFVAPGWMGLAGDRVEAAATAAPRPAAPVKPAPPRDPEPLPVAQALQSGVLIVISKASQTMYVFKNGDLWGKSPVSTGRRGHVTPSGIFPILQKARFHRSNIYSGAPMPWMQRLTWSGIAIHAGQLPGYPASHGCIRLPGEFAKKLFALTNPARTTVVITSQPAKTESAAKSLALAMPAPKPPVQPNPQPSNVPAPATATPPPPIVPEPVVPLQGPGQTIQLSAAASPQEADAQWARLVAAHPELGSYNKAVIPATVGSRRVYRLRATAPGAHAFCSALKRAGTECFNVK